MLRFAVAASLVLLRLEPTARSGQRAGPRHAHCVARGSGPTQAFHCPSLPAGSQGPHTRGR